MLPTKIQQMYNTVKPLLYDTSVFMQSSFRPTDNTPPQTLQTLSLSYGHLCNADPGCKENHF